MISIFLAVSITEQLPHRVPSVACKEFKNCAPLESSIKIALAALSRYIVTLISYPPYLITEITVPSLIRVPVVDSATSKPIKLLRVFVSPMYI